MVSSGMLGLVALLRTKLVAETIIPMELEKGVLAVTGLCPWLTRRRCLNGGKGFNFPHVLC
jgi:hypothetical protein